MPVRTLQLGTGTSSPANALHTLYTCPAGRTAILKDFRLYSDGGCSRGVLLCEPSGAAGVSLYDDAIGATSVIVGSGFVVLEPGDELQVYSEGGTFLALLSGSELDGVAP